MTQVCYVCGKAGTKDDPLWPASLGSKRTTFLLCGLCRANVKAAPSA